MSKKPSYFDSACKYGGDLLAQGTQFISEISAGYLSNLQPRPTLVAKKSQELMPPTFG